MGAELGLYIWIASLRFECSFLVLAQWAGVHMNALEVIAWTDAPTVRDFPVRGNFNPVRLPVHQVLVHGGEYEMNWERCGFEKRRARLGCLLVGVVVVVGGDINRDAVKNRRSVTQFVRSQIFVLEMRIADQAYQRGNAPWSRDLREIYAHGGICLGRRTNRSRDGRPKHVVPSKGIRCSGARHVLKPRVVVVGELRSHGEIEPVGNQRNFVLHKSTEYLRREVSGIQGNDKIAVRMRRRIFVTQSPDDVLSLTPCKMVLEIEIECFPAFHEIVVSLVGVIRNQERGFGTRRENMVPR